MIKTFNNDKRSIFLGLNVKLNKSIRYEVILKTP